MLSLGFSALPAIIWRKQTNAPNKFMGSGMLPAGAYVTLEHEYILIFRKGAKREFSSPADKANRRRERPVLGGTQPLVLRCLDGSEGDATSTGRPRGRENEALRFPLTCPTG